MCSPSLLNFIDRTLDKWRKWSSFEIVSLHYDKSEAQLYDHSSGRPSILLLKNNPPPRNRLLTRIIRQGTIPTNVICLGLKYPNTSDRVTSCSTFDILESYNVPLQSFTFARDYTPLLVWRSKPLRPDLSCADYTFPSWDTLMYHRV